MNDPLSLPATPSRIRAAAEAAGLSAHALDRALEIATASPPAPAWQRFLSRALTLLGTALVLVGVICFIAFNWERIDRFGKFALIEAGIVVAALVGWWRLPRLSGQVALTAAAVLVGPLLAVYGQTYQTGADPYGLFLTWALLIVPWVTAARFTALWVIEVVLVDVALSLWWAQTMAPAWSETWVATWAIVGVVHTVAVVAWEAQMRRRTPWLTAKWAPHELALVGFASLVLAASTFVLDLGGVTGGASLLSAVGLWTLLAAIVAVFWYHRRIGPDRFMVTVAGAAGLALVAVIVGRFVMEDLDLGEFGFLLLGLFIVAEVTFGLRWLRRTQPPAYESEV